MIKLVLMMTVQSAFLVTSQLFLKLGISKIPADGISLLKKSLLFVTNIWVLLSVISMGVAAVIWLYVLKHYDFSAAYPLVSISYILVVPISYFILKENINSMLIAGILFILMGVFLITQSKSIQ